MKIGKQWFVMSVLGLGFTAPGAHAQVGWVIAGGAAAITTGVMITNATGGFDSAPSSTNLAISETVLFSNSWDKDALAEVRAEASQYAIHGGQIESALLDKAVTEIQAEQARLGKRVLSKHSIIMGISRGFYDAPTAPVTGTN